VVSAVLVQPGQTVHKGQVLLTLHDAPERAELASFERQWELQLAKVLERPRDSAAREGLAALRAERERHLALVEERTIRAPERGEVADVWAHEGQVVRPGDALVSFALENATPRLLLALPGYALPKLQPGARVRYSIQGFSFSYLEASVETLSSTVVGPTAVRRFLGNEQGDVLALEGPLVLATAVIPGTTFTVDRQHYNYYSGLRATAWVHLQRQPILLALLPVARLFVSRATP
jgi:membrane fusion protein (multidrug efflux system)